MPEAINLPGIDSSSATPPASSGDTGAPSTTTDDTAASPPAVERDAPREATPSADPAAPTTTDDDEGPKSKSGRGYQRRINELVARETQSTQRADRAEQLLHQVVTGLMSEKNAGKQATAAGIGETSEPKKTDYADYTDFVIAKASYDAEQRLLQRLGARDRDQATQREQQTQRERQSQFAQAQEQLHTVFGTQMREAEAQFPDFRDVISNAPYEVPLRVEAAAVSTGAGGLVAYYLAQYPHVMRELDRLPDMLLGQQVSRIVAHMRTSAASLSNAPAPGRPASGRGGGPLDYPKDATPEMHIAWRDRNAPKSKRA